MRRNFCTLPVGVRGNGSGWQKTCRGSLNPASRPRQAAWTSSAEIVDLVTSTADTLSPGVVGHTEHRTVLHAIERQHGLDVGGIDVLPISTPPRPPRGYRLMQARVVQPA
jgi:hypothetical protein